MTRTSTIVFTTSEPIDRGGLGNSGAVEM